MFCWFSWQGKDSKTVFSFANEAFTRKTIKIKNNNKQVQTV